MTCDAKFRPFSSINDTELQCELEHHGESLAPVTEHQATLRNYAFPGSAMIVFWQEDDRRTFRGEWAPCLWKQTGTGMQCVLPNQHRGEHAP